MDERSRRVQEPEHTVGFQTEESLTVPVEMFNDDGIAPLIATGGRYGGEWVINVVHDPAADATILGTVHTERTEDPDVAAATAKAWIEAECERLGLKVAHYVNHNNRYGPDERPYFTTAQVLLVDKDWV
jgi:hypothetical protein